MATTITVAQMDGLKQPNVIDPTKKPGRGKIVMRTQLLNFAKMAGTLTLAVSDTYQAIPVYPGEVVLAAGINNIVVDSAADDLNLGMTGGVTDFFLDGHSAATLQKVASTDGYFDGSFYCVTADTLDVLEAGGANAVSDGTIEVWALIARGIGRGPTNML